MESGWEDAPAARWMALMAEQLRIRLAVFRVPACSGRQRATTLVLAVRGLNVGPVSSVWGSHQSVK